MNRKEKVAISCISGHEVPDKPDESDNSEVFSTFQSHEHIISLANKQALELELENGEETVEEQHQVTHPTSYMDTLLHLFRGNIGSGLLAMGDAFKNGGLIFAPIMTAILGIICVHAQHILLDCSDEMFRKTKRAHPPDFADTVALVFENGPVSLRPLAPTMKIVVNTFLCITQLGFCCIYIVFIANNTKIISDHYNVMMDLSVHMIFVIIPILLLSMVRNLKYLTPFSTIANLLMALGVGAVLYEASHGLPAVTSRDYIGSFDKLPLYFGTAIYAFEGIGLVLPLKNEMRRPEQFQKPFGVLNVGMVVVACIFIVVGFLGYLKWGDEVAGSLTLNLNPDYPISQVVQVLITLAILFTYPLQFYVPIAITWPAIRRKYGNKTGIAMELGFRASVMTLTFILAESIPQLGLFISLVGAISSTALALIFPPLLQLVLSYNNNNRIPRLMLIKNVLIMALGLYIFVYGTYESVVAILRAFNE